MQQWIRRAWPACLTATALAFAAFSGPRLYEHRNDRCRGAVFDVQFAHALRLREDQAEEIEEMGASLAALCTLDDVHLARVRARLHGEAAYSDDLVKFLRLQRANDDGLVDPNGHEAALAQRRKLLQKQPANASPASAAQWRSLGPTNLPGRIAALAVDPANPQHLLIGTAQAGLWGSADEGISWAPIVGPPGNLPVLSITFGRAGSGIVYAGVGAPFGTGVSVTIAIAVYRSVDSGATWTPLPATSSSSDPTTSFSTLNGLALSPADENVLIATTRCAIQRSVDGGQTWSSVYSACGAPSASAPQIVPGYPRFDPSDPSHAVAGGKGGVVVSRDGGKTWSAVPIVDVLSTSYVNPYFAASTPGLLYAATYAGQTQGLLYKSTDGGTSWKKVNSFDFAYGEYTNQIWVDPGNSNLVVVGGVALWRTSDGGATFTLLSGISYFTQDGASPHADQHAIAIPANYDTNTNRKVFIGNDGGVAMTADIAAATESSGWVQRSDLLTTAQFYGIASSADGRVILAGAQDQGAQVYRGGTAWADNYARDMFSPLVDQDNPSNTYITQQYFGVARSRDGGNTWQDIGTNLPDIGNSNFGAPLLLDPSNQHRLYGGGRSLWVLADATLPVPTWVAIKPPSAVDQNYISTIAVAPSDPNVIWVGHNNGELYVTTSGLAPSPTWNRITSTKATRFVNTIHIDPVNPNHVHVGYAGSQAGGLIATADGGTSWSDITGDLPKISVYRIVHDPAAPNTLYVATDIGLYWSTTGGNTWTASPSGPSDATITGLAWIPASGDLLVSTFGRGAFLLSGASAPAALAYPPVKNGAVFSTAQPGSQSYLRIFNAGLSSGTVTATLFDSVTGQQLGQWTSPSISAGAEAQYFIGTIESGAGPGPSKPDFYSLSLQATIPGYFQHVLYRPADGTLTNLSTCAAGVTADAAKVSGVHSSLVSGFPSSIVLNNTNDSGYDEIAELGIFDARDGTKLGTYVSPLVAVRGHVVVPVSAIEQAIGKTPTPGEFHYVIRIENTFVGFLQHLVNNTKAGVITDMTTVCALDGKAPARIALPLTGGAIFSTAQASSQSYLRFFNTGVTAGAVRVNLIDPATGKYIATWDSPKIPPGGEAQYPVSTFEANLSANFTAAAKPSTFATQLFSGLTGTFQHVLYRPDDGTLTNLSTCDSGVMADPTKLSGVHTTILGGFPSSVVVNNTGAVATTVSLGIYDARDATKLGTYTTAAIPPNGQAILGVGAMEATIGKSPTPDMAHYVIKAETDFTGFLQHLVNNTKAGVITDMTTSCAMPLNPNGPQ